jgi:peroxiredoxin (alkyl hydroperoxide reductase subunit C)
MIHPNSHVTKNVRGVFIIDPDDKIRAFFFYPMTTGRNIEEIKRTLLALQLSEKKDVFTPVNWQFGDEVLLPSPETKEKADAMMKKDNPKVHALNWYTWFMKM